ncbi:MAG: hypothetical protein LBF35_32190, partial [Methylobacterium sp.]|nr:hypothetical protein [Methylobacterium sp.]
MAEEFLGGEDEGAAPAVLDGRGGQGVGGMRLVPLGSPEGADPLLQPWADATLALVRGGGASAPWEIGIAPDRWFLLTLRGSGGQN